MPEYDLVLHDGLAGELTLEGRPVDPDGTILLQGVEGLDGRELRDEVLDLPDRDGDYLGGVRQAGVVLIMRGRISAPHRLGLRQRETALRRALAPTDATWPMRVAGREGDPEDMVILVRTSSPLRSADRAEDGRTVKEWQAAVRSASSVLYGAAEHELQSTPVIGLGGLALPLAFPLELGGGPTPGETIVNDGDGATWPTLQVFGPITQPIIENLTTGLSVAFDGTLAEGEVVSIDTATGGVTYAGGASAYHLLDRSATTFWSLPPGTSQVRIRASAYTDPARLVVTWRNAYL